MKQYLSIPIKLYLISSFLFTVEAQGTVWLGKLHNIEELFVSENLAIDDSTLLALSNGCPKLRYNTSNCADPFHH